MPHVNLDKLRSLLNHPLNYQGVSFQVIEILADEPALVLRDRHDHKIIQPNQYGDASGWAPRTFTVALLNDRRDGLNPDLPELAALDLLA